MLTGKQARGIDGRTILEWILKKYTTLLEKI